MSKDTIKQKIDKNIRVLLNKSEQLSKKHLNDKVFDYIKAWCYMVVEHHEQIYTIDFDDEIEMLEKVIEKKPNSKSLKSYYSCVLKTNNMIKKKYESKRVSPVDGLRQALREMKLIREGKLPKRDIHKFLNKLEKEIQEGNLKTRNGYEFLDECEKGVITNRRVRNRVSSYKTEKKLRKRC
ncbi:hypothetical protein [Clostridium tagluense]|uniref:hypothetical protein n=1 Tax=Clostridium tagluense TaxID=360422 RepID=UPI001CF163FE|nr:hypothetical protein [Clostridium tagluense]MCB2299892.1 hypothetical protein [Clostridium tagluense]